jgi:hypothetical protein
MGIWLSFKNSKIDFSCSYTYWNIIRVSIIKSFMIYLENWININSTTFVQGESFEFYRYEDLKQLVTDYKNINYLDNDKNYDINLIFFKKNINALTCFNFGGIYALVDKEDCEAYYSCGNAYDICNILETIDDNIDKEHYDPIMRVKSVFQHSTDSKEPICVS